MYYNNDVMTLRLIKRGGYAVVWDISLLIKNYIVLLYSGI